MRVINYLILTVKTVLCWFYVNGENLSWWDTPISQLVTLPQCIGGSCLVYKNKTLRCHRTPCRSSSVDTPYRHLAHPQNSLGPADLEQDLGTLRMSCLGQGSDRIQSKVDPLTKPRLPEWKYSHCGGFCRATGCAVTPWLGWRGEKMPLCTHSPRTQGLWDGTRQFTMENRTAYKLPWK